MSVSRSPFRSSLADDINRRLLTLMAVIGLLGSALTAASTGVLALLQANRNIARQTDQIAASVSTFLQVNTSRKEQQRMLQVFRSQPLSKESDTITAILVLNSLGKVELSSRPSLLNLPFSALQLPQLLQAGVDRERIECFIDTRGQNCPPTSLGWHLPWQPSQSELRIVRLFSFDDTPREESFLVLVTFGSEATNRFVFQQVAVVLTISMLILGALLTVLTLGLKQKLLPELHAVAETDALTGLINRRTFMELAERRLSQAHDDGLSILLVMVDIDYFKRINDTHGHVAGDLVLKNVAQQLRTALRDDDLVGRLGGEEFGLLLQISSQVAHDLLERVRLKMERLSSEFEGETIQATISLGVASTDQLGYDLASLYSAADAALYRAKEDGRNRVRWASARRNESSTTSGITP